MSFEETSVQEMEKKLRLSVPTTYRKFNIRETVVFSRQPCKVKWEASGSPMYGVCVRYRKKARDAGVDTGIEGELGTVGPAPLVFLRK